MVEETAPWQLGDLPYCGRHRNNYARNGSVLNLLVVKEQRL